MIYQAEQYDILPGKEVAGELYALLQTIAKQPGEKTLVFSKGTYYLDSENAASPMLYITNTIGDNEWKTGEEPHRNRVGLYLQGIEHLTIEGNGCEFVMRGQMTNMAVSQCQDIEIRDLAFRAENPDMHELKVVAKRWNTVDFELDRESTYTQIDNAYYFTGKDFKVPFLDHRVTAHWIGQIPADNEDTIRRVHHPMFGAYRVREIAPYTFRATYLIAPRYRIGDAFYLFDVRRKYQGIFAERCSDLRLSGISQHFNYGLANVFQDCADVTVSHCNFVPYAGSSKRMASVADFMQVCMCRGQVRIEDNTFIGAGDDCLNVHGIHFLVTNVQGQRVTVRFMHKQSHGFCPFRAGDAVRYIDVNTLQEQATNVVEQAKLIAEDTIELVLRDPVDAAALKGIAIENATACPNVTFCRNTMKRIITRGILLTTSGKVLVEDNRFDNTSMHSVLIADDAKNWYESGMVRDVTIRGNYFGRCEGYTLAIKPENTRSAGYVHRNIRIVQNVIDSNGQGGYYLKDADQVQIADNTVRGKIRRTVCKNSNIIK